MTDNKTAGVLYAIVCGAGPASRISTFIALAQAEGWEVCCIATPAAVEHFLDVRAVQELSGHHVRSNYRVSGEESFPRANAIAVAPATYNTINKWAAGISDTYALNMLAELTGLNVPTAVLPFVNTALAANRVFTRSIDELRASGVNVLIGPGGFRPHPPRTGSSVLDHYPWHLALDALREHKRGSCLVAAGMTHVSGIHPVRGRAGPPDDLRLPNSRRHVRSTGNG